MKSKILLVFLLATSLLPFVRATTVIGTTNITFADTIVAKVVSEIYNYPIVTLDKDNVPNETIELLKELNTTEVLIIGGPAVVSPIVEEKLKELGYNVTRIWGVTRYETSALVSKLFWTNASEAVIVTRELTSERAKMIELAIVRDAINLAISKGVPLMITPRGTLDLNVIDALITLGTKKVYIFTTKKPRHIIEQLERLNISYSIIESINVSATNCDEFVKVAVPENASWVLGKNLLVGFKCLKIFAYEDPEEVPDADFIITKNEDAHKIVKHVIKELRERVKRRNVGAEMMLYNRVDALLEDLQEELITLREYYNNTGNQVALLMIDDLEQKIDKITSLLKQGRIKDALKLALREQNEIRRFKWEVGIYKFEEEIGEKVRNIVEVLVKQRVNLVKRLYGIEDEELETLVRSRARIPDLQEIKRHIREKLKRKHKHNLSGVILCPDISRESDIVYCTMEYNPVCGAIETSFGIIWETFPNPCVACQMPKVVGYIPGNCKGEIDQDREIEIINKTADIPGLVENKPINIRGPKGGFEEE